MLSFPISDEVNNFLYQSNKIAGISYEDFCNQKIDNINNWCLADIVITYNFIEDEKQLKPTNTIDLSTCYKIIDQLFINSQAQTCIPVIKFWGGEPLLYFDEIIKPCLLYIKEKFNCNFVKINCSINNLALLTDDILLFLKEYNCYPFVVYNDGLFSDDYQNQLMKLLLFFPLTEIRLYINNNNLQFLSNQIKTLQSLNVLHCDIIPTIFEKWDYLKNEKILKFELDKLLIFYIKSFEDFKLPLIPKFCSQMLVKIYLLANHYNKWAAENNSCSKIGFCDRINACGLGLIGNVWFDINGNIYSCSCLDNLEFHFNNKFLLGNINDNAYTTVETFYSLYNESLISCFQCQSYELFKCERCEMNDICTGGCLPKNYILNNDFNLISKNFCLFNKECYDFMTRLLNEFNPDNNTDINFLFREYFFQSCNGGIAHVC